MLNSELSTAEAAGGSRSLVEAVTRRVRAYIRSNGLKVGDGLPSEARIASDLGVSKAVVREAFGALAALRQIDVGNGRRARVGAIDGSVMGASLDHAFATSQVSLAEIWEVRRTLELRTAELAATNRDAEAPARIRELAEAMAHDDGELDATTRHDILFHQEIARASGNALFLQIVRSFELMMSVAVPMAWRTRSTAEQRASMLDHHRQVAAAIAAGDPQAAALAMNAHFDASIGDMLAAGDPLFIEPAADGAEYRLATAARRRFFARRSLHVLQGPDAVLRHNSVSRTIVRTREQRGSGLRRLG